MWAGALVKSLFETTHVPEVVCSNPGTIYWMDLTFFTCICCKNCIVLFEKTENKQIEAGLAHLKNCNIKTFYVGITEVLKP